jgi:hypothetical protein
VIVVLTDVAATLMMQPFLSAKDKGLVLHGPGPLLESAFLWSNSTGLLLASLQISTDRLALYTSKRSFDLACFEAYFLDQL